MDIFSDTRQESSRVNNYILKSWKAFCAARSSGESLYDTLFKCNIFLSLVDKNPHQQFEKHILEAGNFALSFLQNSYSLIYIWELLLLTLQKQKSCFRNTIFYTEMDTTPQIQKATEPIKRLKKLVIFF